MALRVWALYKRNRMVGWCLLVVVSATLVHFITIGSYSLSVSLFNSGKLHLSIS